MEEVRDSNARRFLLKKGGTRKTHRVEHAEATE